MRADVPHVTALRRATSATSRATRALVAVTAIATATVAVAKSIIGAGTITGAKATNNKQQTTSKRTE
jgi:hypothetical protein